MWFAVAENLIWSPYESMNKVLREGENKYGK
jgi:hypothetical protein